MVAIKTNTQDTIQSPFGMVMPGRNWTAATATGYGFGFNGKLKDDDIMGSSNSYDFGARIYDARIAKWLSCDPAQCEYPHTSTYAFALNNPLIFLDPDGKRVYYAGGASFKPDKNYRQENFHTRYIGIISAITNNNIHVIKGDRRNSIAAAYWAEVNGSRPISKAELTKPDNRYLLNAVNEIMADYNNISNSKEPINLIGSSYGSVVIAQAALAIAETGQFVNSVTLTGSPIDRNSPLYEALVNNKNIGQVIWIDAPEDPVVESAGNTPREGKKSFIKFIINPKQLAKHLRLGKDEDGARTKKVITKQIILNKVEGESAASNAEKYIK